MDHLVSWQTVDSDWVGLGILYACMPNHFKSCLTLCDPTECSRPGFSVPGILQARILGWVAISSSGDLPHSGIKQVSPELAGKFLPYCHLGSPPGALGSLSNNLPDDDNAADPWTTFWWARICLQQITNWSSSLILNILRGPIIEKILTP